MTTLAHLDHLARAWVVTHRLASLDRLMLALSAVGSAGAVFVAIGLAVTIARRRVRDVAQVVLAIVCASMLSDGVLKPIVHRQRPFVATPQIAVLGERPNDNSFPSGHSTNAFAGALTLSVLVPAGAGVWCALAAAIAYSRVYVGVHYPGDVIGGALLGLAVGASVSAACAAAVARARPAGSGRKRG